MKIVPHLIKHKKFFITGLTIPIIGCAINLLMAKPQHIATLYGMQISKSAPALIKAIADDNDGLRVILARQAQGVITLQYEADSKEEARSGLVKYANKYINWQPKSIKFDRHIKEEEEKPKYYYIIFVWLFMGNFILFGLAMMYENRIALFYEDEEYENSL